MNERKKERQADRKRKSVASSKQTYFSWYLGWICPLSKTKLRCWRRRWLRRHHRHRHRHRRRRRRRRLYFPRHHPLLAPDFIIFTIFTFRFFLFCFLNFCVFIIFCVFFSLWTRWWNVSKYENEIQNLYLQILCNHLG